VHRIILVSALLLAGCMTTPAATSSASSSTAQQSAPGITAELLARLSELLAQNQDLRKAYLVVAPDNSGYILVPTFDGHLNMTSLYEAVDMLEETVPESQITLALLTPGDLKRNFSRATPFYVRP